jgi:general stress protein YciG
MPGNKQGSGRGFASMDEDKQREIASEGGKASGGNFANDPERAAEAARAGNSPPRNDPAASKGPVEVAEVTRVPAEVADGANAASSRPKAVATASRDQAPATAERRAIARAGPSLGAGADAPDQHSS